MSIKSLVAAVTISVAAIASPAFAMDMKTINGSAIPQDEVALVQQYCESLQSIERSSSNSQDIKPSRDSRPDFGPAEATLSFNLRTLSLAECLEGGWVA